MASDAVKLANTGEIDGDIVMGEGADRFDGQDPAAFKVIGDKVRAALNQLAAERL